DENGKYVKAVLKDALVIPTYPQDIFSVRAATSNGANVKFSQDKNELVYKDGTTFIIEEHERLYYLNTVNQLNDDSNISSSYDKVKCLRSDSGTEFMNGDFQDLLRKRAIKHEPSCPNSPHQNGTAE
ncbi:myosin heavy fast skeletal muscle, partial [Paramuricea clavata]